MEKIIIYLSAVLMLCSQVQPALGQDDSSSIASAAVGVITGDPTKLIPVVIPLIYRGTQEGYHINEAEAYSQKAYSSYLQGLYDLALNNIDKSIEEYGKLNYLQFLYKSKESNAWNIKGNILLRLEQYEDAIDCFDMSIEINPNSAYSWNNKGLALYDLRRYNEAIRCYDTAIYLDPSLTIAFNNKYAAQQKLGENYQSSSNPTPTSPRPEIQFPQPQDNGNTGICKWINTPYGQMLQCEGGSSSSGSIGIGAPGGIAVT